MLKSKTEYPCFTYEKTYGSVQRIAIFRLRRSEIDVSHLREACLSIPIRRAKNGWIRESSKVFKQFSRPATLKSITIDLFAMGAEPFRLFEA